MILLLGGTGYVGTAYRQLFEARGVNYRSVSRADCDYSRKEVLRQLIQTAKPDFLINAAGYTGKPNVDACETDQTNCLLGNTILPGIIAEVCAAEKLSWGQVSSGCIYTGARPDGSGFTEEDAPNFSFRQNNSSFYSGTKALGEEVIAGVPNTYLWRLRLPFNEVESPRNYLTKLIRYEKVIDFTNSLSQLQEFVSATWETWERRAPFGIYNVTNPGPVTTKGVVELLIKTGVCRKNYEFFADEAEFMKKAAKANRSNCVLDSSKLLKLGIPMSDGYTAVEKALRHWKKTS